jgi:chemotaxis protein MotB
MSAAPVDGFGSEPEAHENHERYLITYADMITLLMALFIILFAIAQVDLARYAEFAEGARAAVGGTMPMDGPPGGSLAPMSLTAPAAGPHVPSPAAPGDVTAEGAAAAERDAAASLAMTVAAADVRAAIAALDPSIAEVHEDERGLVVRLAADGVLFDSGSSALLPGAAALVAELGTALQGTPGQVLVEGHTDDRPVAPPSSNWELSAVRATAVLRALVTAGVAPARLSAVARGDAAPIADNATDEGRAANRRVEVVIVTAVPIAAAPAPAHPEQEVPAAHRGTGTPAIHLDLADEAFADHGGAEADGGGAGH